MKTRLFLLAVLLSLFSAGDLLAAPIHYYGRVVGVSSVIGMPDCFIYRVAIFHDHGTPNDMSDDVLLVTANVFSEGCDGMYTGPTQDENTQSDYTYDLEDYTDLGGGCLSFYGTVYERATMTKVGSGTINSCSSGKKEVVEPKLNAPLVYPTVVDHFLKVDLNGANQGAVSIHSLSGVRVYTKVADSEVTEIDLRQLAPGVYFVTVEVGSNSPEVVKIIKH